MPPRIDFRAIPLAGRGEDVDQNERRYRSEVQGAFDLADQIFQQFDQRLSAMETSALTWGGI